MSPPVASLFDQVRHAAPEQPTREGSSASEKASGEGPVSTSTSQQQRAHDSQANLNWVGSSRAQVSGSSNDVAGQAHDRSAAAQGQSQDWRSQPQLSSDDCSSSSSSVPLPGRYQDSTARMPTMSIGCEGVLCLATMLMVWFRCTRLIVEFMQLEADSLRCCIAKTTSH